MSSSVKAPGSLIIEDNQGHRSLPSKSSFCAITLCALGVITVLGGFAAAGLLLPHMGYMSFTIAGGATLIGGCFIAASCMLMHKKSSPSPSSSISQNNSPNPLPNLASQPKAEVNKSKVVSNLGGAEGTPDASEDDEPEASEESADLDAQDASKTNIDPKDVSALFQKILDDKDDHSEVDSIIKLALDNGVLMDLIILADQGNILNLILAYTDLEPILELAQKEDFLGTILKAAAEDKILPALWRAAKNTDVDLVKAADDCNILHTILNSALTNNELNDLLDASHKEPNPLFGDLKEEDISEWLRIVNECIFEASREMDDEEQQERIGLTIHEATKGNKNFGGRNHLHYAAGMGDFTVVAFLMKNGVDVHTKDDQGATPLHYAVKAGSSQIVQWLLKDQRYTTARAHLQLPVHIYRWQGKPFVSVVRIGSNK